MNYEEEARKRRNIVSQMYDNDTWHERVASMPADQVTAIYLRYIRSVNKPRPATPEALDIELNESPRDYTSLRLF